MELTESQLRTAYAYMERTAAENRRADKAPADVRELKDGPLHLAVRLRGAMIVACTLEPPYGGEAQKVLSAGKNLQRPDLTASFAMSPVDRLKRKQHGLSGMFQWLDFVQEYPDLAANGMSNLGLVTTLGKTGLPLMRRGFELSQSLTTTTRLYNHGPKTVRAGLGEHYNLKHKGKKARDLLDIRINGSRLRNLLVREAEDLLMEGKPVIWNDFDGHADIRLPGGKVVSLDARTKNGYRDQLGMIIRARRPDKPSLAFQPTLGIEPSKDAWGIDIPP